MHRRIFILLVILLVLPISVYLVLRATNFFGRAGGTPANLVIDTGTSYPMASGVWANLAQGGEEEGRMLQPVVSKVKSLRPEYIRIDHVFDYYNVVSRDSSGALFFNWSNLDETISDIRAIGATPFINISYMPLELSGRDITDLPKNWGEWETAVQSLVEHISGKRSLNLNNVYYEVWNEPDLFGGFKTYGDKNYLDLYLHTEKGVTRTQNVNFYKIGGPATTGFYSSWFDSLLNFSQANGLRLDFFSWHRYSKDLSDYENDYLNARGRLLNFPNFSNIELIISEIGPNSENDSVYDGNFAAIHTIATSAVLEGNVRRSFIFEIKDGPGEKKYWGRWGLFTNEKFGEPSVKPRFSAIQFLNQMIGDRVNVAGQGSWVKSFAKEHGGTIRTLVVNYDPNGNHFEAVPMTFINLKTGNFLFRRLDFGGGMREARVATTSATWATLQGFNANSASIFELIPQ